MVFHKQKSTLNDNRKGFYLFNWFLYIIFNYVHQNVVQEEIKFMRSLYLITVILFVSGISFGQSKKKLKNTAQVCFDLRNYACAEEALLKALKLDSTDHFLLNNLGMVQRRLNKPQEALISFSKVLELVPDDIFALNGKAGVLILFKDYENALYLLNKAHQQSSFNESTLLLRSAVYRHLKNPEAALSDLKNILQIKPNDFAARSNIALLKKEQGDSVNAKSDFIMLLTERPKDVISINALAEIELTNKNFQAASDYTDKAISIDSEYANAYLTRGRIRLCLGQKDLACQDFRIASKYSNGDLSEYLAGNLEDCDR